MARPVLTPSEMMTSIAKALDALKEANSALALASQIQWEPGEQGGMTEESAVRNIRASNSVYGKVLDLRLAVIEALQIGGLDYHWYNQ